MSIEERARGSTQNGQEKAQIIGYHQGMPVFDLSPTTKFSREVRSNERRRRQDLIVGIALGIAALSLAGATVHEWNSKSESSVATTDSPVEQTIENNGVAIPQDDHENYTVSDTSDNNKQKVKKHKKHKKHKQSPDMYSGPEKVRFGTYNVRTGMLNNRWFGDNDNRYDSDDRRRMNAAGSIIQQSSLGVVMVQEARGQQLHDLVKAIPNYTTTGFDTGGLDSESHVIWDKTKYELLDRGKITIPKYSGQNRNAVWVKLKDKRTGEPIIFVSMHASTTNDALREKAARNIKEAMARISDNGRIPVIVGGDMNSNDMAPARNGVHEVFVKNGNYVDLKDEAEKSLHTNCDTQTSPGDGHQDCHTRGQGSHIDMLLANRAFVETYETLVWSNVVTDRAQNVSDHNLLYTIAE